MSVDALQARSHLSDGVAAVPDLTLATTCLAAIFVPTIGKRFAPTLLNTLGLEFLAIHAFVFLGFLALKRPKRPWSKILRVVAFVAVTAFYSFFAGQWGTDALVSFWLLIVSTYFGFFVQDAPEDRRRMLLCRWGVVFATFLGLFVLCALVFEVFNVHAPTKGFLFGFTFFFTLAVFDVTRFYERVLHKRFFT